MSRMMRTVLIGVAAFGLLAGVKASNAQSAQPQPQPQSGAAARASKPAPPPGAPSVDLAFGAYQRGFFLTALQEALARVKENPGDRAAMTLLGELYRDGLGVRRNLEEAARWYRLAADRGDRNAQFRLGLAHLTGEGAPKDRTLARQWLEKAAAQEHGGALYNLGVMAIDGDTQDFPAAAGLFAKAARVGDMDAAYALAVFYREGKGVEPDRAASLRWLRRAAEEKHVAAMVEFAIALFNGAEGVEKDEGAAARMLGLAAQLNSPVAQNRLARLYVTGRGVKPDVVEGMKWHILARANGLRDDWLDGRLAALSPVERMAVEEAVQRFIGN
jgi:TPR repeat protein